MTIYVNIDGKDVALNPQEEAAFIVQREDVHAAGLNMTNNYSVTRAQALMALYKAGILDQVKQKVAAHPLEEVRIWYENALNWTRFNPYVMAIGEEMNLTDEQIDDLFIAATTY